MDEKTLQNISAENAFSALYYRVEHPFNRLEQYVAKRSDSVPYVTWYLLYGCLYFYFKLLPFGAKLTFTTLQYIAAYVFVGFLVYLVDRRNECQLMSATTEKGYPIVMWPFCDGEVSPLRSRFSMDLFHIGRTAISLSMACFIFSLLIYWNVSSGHFVGSKSLYLLSAGAFFAIGFTLFFKPSLGINLGYKMPNHGIPRGLLDGPNQTWEDINQAKASAFRALIDKASSKSRAESGAPDSGQSDEDYATPVEARDARACASHPCGQEGRRTPNERYFGSWRARQRKDHVR
jgi:hypothetical protein